MSVKTFDIATALVMTSTLNTAYDADDRVLSSLHEDGSTTEMVYSCCGLSQETDRTVTVTGYTRNQLSRMTSMTRDGITSTYELAS